MLNILFQHAPSVACCASPCPSPSLMINSTFSIRLSLHVKYTVSACPIYGVLCIFLPIPIMLITSTCSIRLSLHVKYIVSACAICGVLCISLPIPIIVKNCNIFYESVLLCKQYCFSMCHHLWHAVYLPAHPHHCQ